MDKRNLLRRYTTLPFLIDYLSTKELALVSPKSWDDRNDSFYLEQYATMGCHGHIFVLCMTQAPETYHHWKIFSSGESGVCIEFKHEQLIASVKKISNLRANSVIYETIENLRTNRPDISNLPFLKRYPYRDEQEFRLFATLIKPPKDNLIRFHVPLNAVDRITLSPWLPKTVVKNTKEFLKRIPGCSSVKICRSTLVENELWKRYGIVLGEEMKGK